MKAKSKNKQKTNAVKISAPISYVFDGDIKRIAEFFPTVKLTKWSELNPGKPGSDYIIEIKLPSNYTLIKKSVSAKGAITCIEFSVQKKYCSESQTPGNYRFSAHPF